VALDKNTAEDVEMNDWILCFGQVDCILQADNSECVVA
jgi:hypothetical protein